MDSNPNKRARTDEEPAQPIAGPSSAAQDSVALLTPQQQSTVLRQLLADSSTSARTKLYVSRALAPPRPATEEAMDPVLADKIKAIEKEMREAISEVDKEWPSKRREGMEMEWQEIFERNDANDEPDDEELFDGMPGPDYPDALCDLIPSILELRLSLPGGPRAAFKLLLDLAYFAFPGDDSPPPDDPDDFCNDIDNAMLHVLKALDEAEGLDLEKDREAIEETMAESSFEGLEFQSSLEYLEDVIDPEGGEDEEEVQPSPPPRGFTDGEVVELADTDEEEDDGEIVCLS